MPSTQGVLLINLGTPESPAVPDVRRFLREFLRDPRVIDLPAPLRHALLETVILPFRPRRSAAAYAKIWMGGGSPLLVYGRALAEALGKSLGAGFHVELAMRYGNPSIATALGALAEAAVEPIIVAPLFPQYAESSTGSALAHVESQAASRRDLPTLRSLSSFYADLGFITALAKVARPVLDEFAPDHLLLSYHGLPEKQVRRGGPHCLTREGCCDAVPKGCYRAHCFATTRALASELDLAEGSFSTAFQSRLGRAKWIGPSLEERLASLREANVKRLAVACPSFVADCLETLEEIGIRARETWKTLGGEELRLVPCVNAHPEWVRALADLVRSS